MEINKAIAILKDYVIKDREIRDTTDYSSDFDKFCEEKCVAIETVLKYACDKLPEITPLTGPKVNNL